MREYSLACRTNPMHTVCTIHSLALSRLRGLRRVGFNFLVHEASAWRKVWIEPHRPTATHLIINRENGGEHTHVHAKKKKKKIRPDTKKFELIFVISDVNDLDLYCITCSSSHVERTVSLGGFLAVFLTVYMVLSFALISMKTSPLTYPTSRTQMYT